MAKARIEPKVMVIKPKLEVVKENLNRARITFTFTKGELPTCEMENFQLVTTGMLAKLQQIAHTKIQELRITKRREELGNG